MAHSPKFIEAAYSIFTKMLSYDNIWYAQNCLIKPITTEYSQNMYNLDVDWCQCDCIPCHQKICVYC